MQKSFDKKKMGFGSELWNQLGSTDIKVASSLSKQYIDGFSEFQKNFARLNELYENSISEILLLKKEIEDLKSKN
jgi:hypothetical protein